MPSPPASDTALPKVRQFHGDLPWLARPIAGLPQNGPSSCTVSERAFDMLIAGTCCRLRIFRQPPGCAYWTARLDA